MKSRTEEDILAQKPIVFKLGDKEHEIKPMTIGKARKWREQLAPVIEKILSHDGAMDSTEKLRSAITSSPDEMVEIVASYSGLDKSEIDESATEEQITLAFHLIMGIAFSPFLNQQAVMKTAMNPSLLASLPSTKLH